MDENSIFKVLRMEDWIIIILLNVLVWPLGIGYNLYYGQGLTIYNFWGIMVAGFLFPAILYMARLWFPRPPDLGDSSK